MHLKVELFVLGDESGALQVGWDGCSHLLEHFGILLLKLVILVISAIHILKPGTVRVVVVVVDSPVTGELVAALIELTYLILQLKQPRCATSMHFYENHLWGSVNRPIFLYEKI